MFCPVITFIAYTHFGVYVMWNMIPTGLLICDKWHSQIHYNLVFCFFFLLISQNIQICCERAP